MIILYHAITPSPGEHSASANGVSEVNQISHICFHYVNETYISAVIFNRMLVTLYAKLRINITSLGIPGTILSMGLANERRRYIVT